MPLFMATPQSLTDAQQDVLATIAALEAAQSQAPSLEQLADRLQRPVADVRETVSGLLSDGADLVRELSGDDLAEATYTLKQSPMPEGD
jgi:hypothetical protein